MVLWQHKAAAAAAGMSASSPDTAEKGDRGEVSYYVKTSRNLLAHVDLFFSSWMKYFQILSVQRRDGYAKMLDCVCLHEQAARCRHGPLLSPTWTFKGVTEGALPQHGFYQDLKHSQTQDGYNVR